MCGITGFLTSDARPEIEAKSLVCHMANQLAHRGPDDLGVWVDAAAGIALGHRRLSILDLSPEGHQPMQSASGRFVMVYNGEVYNFGSLRSELESRGHHFRGHSDTEVMLAAMEQWGIEKSVQRFNGMFAIGIWDSLERKLHLIRDRLGEKPLYYGWAGKSFLFGSELKALVAHPDFRRDIDRNSVAMYLRHSCIPTPYSIYEGIRKLPPGARVVVRLSDRGSLPAPMPYWSASEAFVRGAEDPFTGTAEEALEGLDELMRDAVKTRMVADVPLGAFLSGGVDSSTIVALMQEQSDRPVRTFSIGFYESAYNEAEYAAAAAKHLGTDHTEFYVSPEDILPTIPMLPTIYDEPFSDSSQIPTYLVSKLTRRYVTVSLSGDGGDELFGGYNRYFLWGRVWDKAKYLPSFARGILSWTLRRLSPESWNHFATLGGSFPAGAASDGLLGDRIHRFARVISAKDSFSRYQAIVSVAESPSDIVKGSEEPGKYLAERCQGTCLTNFGEQMMLADSVTYLPDDILAKVDRASMAVSLESRAPFLDHRVFEFAGRLPFEMKIRNGRGKWLLRRLERKYLPKGLVERPKKGFSLPIAEWLRGALREWAEHMLSKDGIESEGFFRSEEVGKLWRQHLSRQRDVEHHVWGILMFQAWLERWHKQASRETRIPEAMTERSEAMARA